MTVLLSLPSVHELTDHIVTSIARAPIDCSPFPHIIIDHLLPNDVYADVLAALPDRTHFEKVRYPGTGFGRNRRSVVRHEYGYAYRDLASAPGALQNVHGALSSPEFTQALLDKFAAPQPNGSTPIPRTKHRFFADGARDFTTVFDLQVDLPGYAIPPHPDVEEKIVTFQLYLSRDDSLADFGTLLCEPTDRRVMRGRTRVARAVGHALSRALSRDSQLYRRIERSELGAWSGFGANENWLPWSWFRVTKIAKALPNHFLAFAPNSMSYHAVDLDIPPEKRLHERPVIRGFVRAGKNARNWISRTSD
jgi:hypothetical protein